MQRLFLTTAAVLTAASAHAAELCIVPSGNGVDVTKGCGETATAANHSIGFNTDVYPCETGTFPCNVKRAAAVAPTFSWTISRSAADPLDVVGSIGPGTANVYLWLYCEWPPAGMETAEFGLAGDLTVESFTTFNGFSNTGTATDLRLAVPGCPVGPILAGAIAVSGTVSVEGTTWGRIKSVYR